MKINFKEFYDVIGIFKEIACYPTQENMDNIFIAGYTSKLDNTHILHMLCDNDCGVYSYYHTEYQTDENELDIPYSDYVKIHFTSLYNWAKSVNVNDRNKYDIDINWADQSRKEIVFSVCSDVECVSRYSIAADVFDDVYEINVFDTHEYLTSNTVPLDLDLDVVSSLVSNLEWRCKLINGVISIYPVDVDNNKYTQIRCNHKDYNTFVITNTEYVCVDDAKHENGARSFSAALSAGVYKVLRKALRQSCRRGLKIKLSDKSGDRSIVLESKKITTVIQCYDHDGSCENDDGKIHLGSMKLYENAFEKMLGFDIDCMWNTDQTNVRFNFQKEYPNVSLWGYPVRQYEKMYELPADSNHKGNDISVFTKLEEFRWLRKILRKDVISIQLYKNSITDGLMLRLPIFLRGLHETTTAVCIVPVKSV